MKSHKTRRIALKHADVDLGVEPVVTWLNSFPGVFTRWSCQGDDADHKNHRKNGRIKSQPYVLFYCDDLKDLIEILAKVGPLATTEVDYLVQQGAIRYIMRFGNQAMLKSFVADIGKKYA